jgi:uncharacterized membrane protein
MKISRILFYMLLMTVALVTCLLSTSVLAQEETIELDATYPRVESATPKAAFKFTVDLIYRGDQAREFDLRASGPSGWTTYVTSSDESVRISVIKVEPGNYRPYQVKVIASPPPSVVFEPGDYRIIVEASSGTIRDSIELTAVVMPTYSLDLVPGPRFHREVTAGRDNFFFITAKNTGSGELTSIRFSADKPHDLVVEFQPDEIDRLAPSSIQEIQVNIKPPTSTADRYYDVTLIAEASQTRQKTMMGFRVEESNWLWVWVGGGIALLAIASFTAIFLRLSRGK